VPSVSVPVSLCLSSLAWGKHSDESLFVPCWQDSLKINVRSGIHQRVILIKECPDIVKEPVEMQPGQLWSGATFEVLAELVATGMLSVRDNCVDVYQNFFMILLKIPEVGSHLLLVEGAAVTREARIRKACFCNVYSWVVTLPELKVSRDAERRMILGDFLKELH
jgi:hypothetical protein